MGPTLIGEKTGAPVELVVAVSWVGGLGSSAEAVSPWMSFVRRFEKDQSKTKKPFGVHLLLPKNVAKKGLDLEGVDQLPLSTVLKTMPKPIKNGSTK